MIVTLDAQRATPDARRAMPVSHHLVWCDRAFCVVSGSITLGLCVERVGCLCECSICLLSASQAALMPVAIKGKRGANPSGRDDCTSLRETFQNTFVARYRSIACLVDCYVWLRSISIGYECAYARHTPHARRHAHTHSLRGGVPGCRCCAWFSVAMSHTSHPYVARGRGGPFARVNASVIGQTAGSDNIKIL